MRPCDYLRAVACPTLLQKSQSAAGRDVRRAACGPARAPGSLQRAPPRGMKGALAPEAPRAPHAPRPEGDHQKESVSRAKLFHPCRPLGSPTRPLAARRAPLAHPLPPGTRTAAAASRFLALKSSSSTSSGSALLLSLPFAWCAMARARAPSDARATRGGGEGHRARRLPLLWAVSRTQHPRGRAARGARLHWAPAAASSQRHVGSAEGVRRKGYQRTNLRAAAFRVAKTH